MTAKPSKREFLHIRASSGPCATHDWSAEGFAERLMATARKLHGKGGLNICTDCIERFRASVGPSPEKARARPEPTVEVFLTLDEWSALRDLMERSQGNMEWSLRIVVGEAVCEALLGGDVMAFRTVPTGVTLPKTPQARLRRPPQADNEAWPTKGAAEQPAPEAPQWPNCDWCLTEGKKEQATHIHVHKTHGEKCAHFSCAVHAKEDDGAHVVHVIGEVLGNFPPGRPHG